MNGYVNVRLHADLSRTGCHGPDDGLLGPFPESGRDSFDIGIGIVTWPPKP
jgi:hypothetical protein